MTGEQVHKCSCYNWCGTMQHQSRRAKGQGSKNLMSCCKWYMKDTDHNWHGGGDQATRAWRIPVILSIKTSTLIIKILSIQTWHVINGAVSVEAEEARWRDSYGPLYLLTTASHINTWIIWLKNRPKNDNPQFLCHLLSISICILICILLHGNWQWNMTLQKTKFKYFL